MPFQIKFLNHFYHERLYFIGIDVSKKHLIAVCYLTVQLSDKMYFKSSKEYENYLSILCSEENIDIEQIVICAEYTDCIFILGVIAIKTIAINYG